MLNLYGNQALDSLLFGEVPWLIISLQYILKRNNDQLFWKFQLIWITFAEVNGKKCQKILNLLKIPSCSLKLPKKP